MTGIERWWSRTAAALLVGLTVMGAAPARAQTVGATIAGVVADSQGGALPGVTLTARNDDTGASRVVVTEGDGRYRLGNLPPGRYNLLAELQGFAPVDVSDVTLTIGLEVQQNLTLGLQSLQETVRVSGVAQVVRDLELLERMAVNGKLPELALLVRVREAFFHCGKSMIRSGMWEPARWGSINGLPTYTQALKDHANLPAPLSDIERGVASNETDQLY